jgi:hypothetical protein
MEVVGQCGEDLGKIPCLILRRNHDADGGLGPSGYCSHDLQPALVRLVIGQRLHRTPTVEGAHFDGVSSVITARDEQAK